MDEMNNTQLDKYLDMIIELIKSKATTVDEAIEIIEKAKTKNG